MQIEKGVSLNNHCVASIRPNIKPLESSFYSVCAQVSVVVFICKMIVIKSFVWGALFKTSVYLSLVI